MASQRVRVVITALAGFVERIIKKLALDIVANLTAAPSDGGTPVDTGWARANWIPRIGAPATGTAGTRAQAEAGNVSTLAQTLGQAVLLGYKLPMGRVYISNNVPYILRLNEGHSKQAPRGFVQKAITKAVKVDLPRGFGLQPRTGGGPGRDPTTGRFTKGS